VNPFAGLVKQLLTELREHEDELKELLRRIVREVIREELSPPPRKKGPQS
jgi:hypothetical protein